MVKRDFTRKKGPNVHIAKPRDWECKCPKCGALHILKMHWIGVSRPYKYCDSCKGIVGSLSSGFHGIKQKG